MKDSRYLSKKDSNILVYVIAFVLSFACCGFPALVTLISAVGLSYFFGGFIAAGAVSALVVVLYLKMRNSKNTKDDYGCSFNFKTTTSKIENEDDVQIY